jgi:hypothetical protein
MSESSRPLRIAVLGAGPIGIEAALYGATLGHDIVVIDQGAVGHSVAMWSHVTLFSPWRMNVTPLGLRTLAAAGHPAPPLEKSPTGAELISGYLAPLGGSPLLASRLRLHTRVVAVGRPGLLKGDLIAQQSRADRQFRLLLEDSAGEHLEFADVVLDCTGTYLCPNAIGDGGIAAPGERWLGGRLFRHQPDVTGRDRKRFARRRTLLIGDGLSAATAAKAFAELCRQEPGTEVCWSVRTRKDPPYALFEGDPLVERAQLMAAANRVASKQGQGVTFHPGSVVDALAAEGHQLRVRLRPIDGPASASQEALFDEVIGLTGYGPDRSIYEQLQIHECYASFGPMKLAATLVGASGDCLAQPVPGPETLKNPEPAFFILGAKSYAKNSAFLLQIGHAQVRAAYSLLHKNEGLDLYGPS